jgi:hypothetical protein
MKVQPQGVNPGLSPQAWYKLHLRLAQMNKKYRVQLMEAYQKGEKKVG